MHYVYGAGVSGVAATKLLLSKNYPVTLIETNDAALQKAKKLFEKRVAYVKQPSFFSQTVIACEDTFIPSPGVPQNDPIYRTFLASGCSIVSEVDLFVPYYNGKLIAITGTNGKSTTTSMTSFLLCQMTINAVSAGNIGVSPSELVIVEKQPEVICLEVSSYQLETSKLLRPDVTVFTNFTTDHIERHGSLEEYFKCKWRLILHSKTTPVYLNANTLACAKLYGLALPDNFVLAEHLNFEVPSFKKIPNTLHDKENARAAIMAASILTGRDCESIKHLIQDFPGLAHRCEHLGSYKGIQIINDSKATNVDATVTALRSFQKPCTLLLGGLAKKESFEPILEFDHITNIFVFGADRKKIMSDLKNKKNIKSFESLKVLLENLDANLTDDTKTLLLSPGCASFDEFANFEKRGDAFKAHFKNLLS